MKRTCLYEVHRSLGAVMGPFGGFEMPIQYDGIVAEHQACREGAVLFDTCHMGEFIVSGEQASAGLDRLLSCRVDTLVDGQCRYGFLCNPEGGVIDDLLVYRLGVSRFMLVVNAGTQAGDAAWMAPRLRDDVTFEDVSGQTAKIDLQGPDSPRIVQRILGRVLTGLKYYRFVQTVYLGQPVLLSRTGYTGEMGFELYAAPDQAIAFWQAAMQLGARPAGLGARDTLRLEAGMPLYGHELSVDRNAAESGFSRAICCAKSFVGSEVVCDPVKRRQALVGIRLDGRRAARAGDTLHDASGHEVGVVTSGSFGPSVGAAVALGYIDEGLNAPGTAVTVKMSRGELAGSISALPFWPAGTARKRIDAFLQEA